MDLMADPSVAQRFSGSGLSSRQGVNRVPRNRALFGPGPLAPRSFDRRTDSVLAVGNHHSLAGPESADGFHWSNTYVPPPSAPEPISGPA